MNNSKAIFLAMSQPVNQSAKDYSAAVLVENRMPVFKKKPETQCYFEHPSSKGEGSLPDGLHIGVGYWFVVKNGKKCNDFYMANGAFFFKKEILQNAKKQHKEEQENIATERKERKDKLNDLGQWAKIAEDDKNYIESYINETATQGASRYGGGITG